MAKAKQREAKSTMVRVYPEDYEFLNWLKDQPEVVDGIGIKHIRRTVALAVAYCVRKVRGDR